MPPACCSYGERALRDRSDEHLASAVSRRDNTPHLRKREHDQGNEMGATQEITGKAEELKGKAEEAIGKATGGEKMEATGKADQLKSKAKQAAGEVRRNVEEAGAEARETIREPTR